LKAFFETHQDSVVGVLTTLDRIIFKGHLTGFFPRGAFARFLGHQGVLLKDFKPYVEKATAMLKAHAKQFAGEHGRPYLYLASITWMHWRMHSQKARLSKHWMTCARLTRH